jgi:fatty-acyl-CoA synthase
MNLFQMLERSARSEHGARPAVTFEGDERSFRALRDRALRLARGLHGAGVAPGDRVAVLMGNRHEWPETLFGLAALGAVCVPVNVLLTGREIRHVCRDSEVRCLIVDELGAPKLADLEELPERVVAIGDALADALAYEELPEAELPEGPAGADVLIHYYSSGTTGLPKAAVHSHENVLWNSFGQIIDIGLGPDVRYLVVPSLSWAAGFHNLMLGLVFTGGSSVLMPTGGLTVERIVEAIERERATHVMLVPSLLRQFGADERALERLRRSALRWIVTGAEPVPAPLIELLSAELPGCRVCQGYGMSEFPTIATLLAPEQAIEHAGSAGRPLSHTDVAVLLDDGTIADSGRGELLMRSPATMLRYHGLTEQTEEALAGGWLHTGDLVELDEERFVTIVGRTKDMIISGGLNVYPKEVEDVLAVLPGVGEVAVVGVPDERFGEAPVAVLVPLEGETIDEAELERVCRAELSSYKRPRAVLLHDGPLPRNPTGKLLKRELRPWAAERRAQG